MFEETVSVVSIWASMGSWLTPTVLFVVLNVMIGTIAVTSGFGSSNNQNNKSDNRDYNPNHNHDHPTDNHDDTIYPHQQQHYSPIQPQLSRSPSVLQRLRSINFTSFRFQHYQPTTPITNTAVPTDPVQHTAPVEKVQYTAPVEEVRYTAPVEKVYRDLGAHKEEFLIHRKTENGNEESTVEDQGREEFEPVAEEEGEGEELTMDQIYSQIQMSRSKSDTNPSGGRKVGKLPKRIMVKSASDASAFSHFVAEEEEEDDILRVERRRPATVREVRKEVHPDEEVDAKADDFINKFKQQLKLQKLESNIRTE